MPIRSYGEKDVPNIVYLGPESLLFSKSLHWAVRATLFHPCPGQTSGRNRQDPVPPAGCASHPGTKPAARCGNFKGTHGL